MAKSGDYCKGKYSDYEKIVCLCYDLDELKGSYTRKPKININKVEKAICDLGVKKVLRIAADSTIEDFFLYDMDGIKKFLKLKDKDIPKNKRGLDLLIAMFKVANKVYYKGERVEGFIKSLDFSKIIPNIANEIYDLCYELGYDLNNIKVVDRN